MRLRKIKEGALTAGILALGVGASFVFPFLTGYTVQKIYNHTKIFG